MTSTWNIFVKRHDGKTVTIHLDEASAKRTTVTSFKKLVHDRCGVPPDEQRLIFAGKQLDDDKNLGDYSTLGNRATLFLVLRLPGGSGDSYEKYFDRLRRFPVHAPKHPDECLICYECPALRMPCDHPMCPSCLMNYVWTEVGCNKKTDIHCPHCTCTSEWPLHIIQDYGNVLSEEMELLQECLSTNYIVSDPTISECPGCGNYCERKNKTPNRVYCRICSRLGKPHTYCWNCYRPWNNSGSNVHCGNAGCDTDSFVKILREAPLKALSFLPQRVQVPSRRACPTCGVVIEHIEGCKHIICTVCSIEFCFLCLKKKVEGSSYCQYNTVCTIAPVQDKLPRRL